MLKKKINELDRKVLIFVFSAILLLLLLLIVINTIHNKDNDDVDTPSKIDVSKIKGVYVSDERTYYDDSVFLSGKRLSKEKCFDDICVSDIKIICNEKSGEIDYVLKNNGENKKSIYLKIVIGKYSGYIIKENVDSKVKTEGHIGYSGYDLRKTKSYKLKPMTDDEIKAIVK